MQTLASSSGPDAVQVWHFISPELKLRFTSESFELGKIYHTAGQVSPGQNSLPASRLLLDALKYAVGPVVCLLQVSGEVQEDTDKVCGRERQILAWGNIERQLHRFALDLVEMVLPGTGELTRQWSPFLEIKQKWVEQCVSSDTLAQARAEAQSLAAHLQDPISALAASVLEEEQLWRRLHGMARDAGGLLREISAGSDLKVDLWTQLSRRLEKMVRPNLRYWRGAKGYTRTDFDFSLALQEPRPAEPAQCVNNILIVEDDIDFAEILQDFLASVRSRTTVVRNGAEAVKCIMQQDFDCVLCDMIMPHMPGDMFYMAVQRFKPHLCKKFIFMTGHHGDSRVASFLRKQEGIVLYKPFEMNALVEAMKKMEIQAGTAAARARQ